MFEGTTTNETDQGCLDLEKLCWSKNWNEMNYAEYETCESHEIKCKQQPVSKSFPFPFFVRMKETKMHKANFEIK